MLEDDVVTQMKSPSHSEATARHPATFLGGLLLGGLVSAIALFLFVPQSGQKTRQLIQQKAFDLRDQTTARVEVAKKQASSFAGHFKDDLSDKAKELKQQGKEVLVEQLERVSTAAKNGKKALQG
jgi:gas vesicle protein